MNAISGWISKRRDSDNHERYSFLAAFLVAALVAIFSTLFIFQSYRVDGQSMDNTLHNDDRLIINKIPRTLARITGHPYIPNRGDIVVFSEPGLYVHGGGEQLIKRVLGLPGERIVVKDGQLTVFNQANPQGFNPDSRNLWQLGSSATVGDVDVTLAADQLFVCGDNRTNSTDSRVFGPISANQVVGKLVMRILPLGNTQIF